MSPLATPQGGMRVLPPPFCFQHGGFRALFLHPTSSVQGPWATSSEQLSEGERPLQLLLPSLGWKGNDTEGQLALLPAVGKPISKQGCVAWRRTCQGEDDECPGSFLHPGQPGGGFRGGLTPRCPLERCLTLVSCSRPLATQTRGSASPRTPR